MSNAPGSLVPLLHLCDSLFPLGAFAYSDGLESATQGGLVRSETDVRDWLDVCLDEAVGRCDGPAMAAAWRALAARDWDALVVVDEEVWALRPAAEVRTATRAMGLRLLKTWQALHPDTRLQDALALAQTPAFGPTLPVAFALVTAAAGIDERSALIGYAYTRLAATVSAAMRLVALGQHAAHQLLSRAVARAPGIADAVLASDAPAESFAPAMDVAAMTHQYVESRLFRS